MECEFCGAKIVAGRINANFVRPSLKRRRDGGRRALIGGDDEEALRFFQSVAESNPNFVFATGSSPRQSIWSYVGRAQYLTDQFPQARQSLERAISGDREENIARLYLGLTLV